MKTIKAQLFLNRINIDLNALLTYVHQYNLKHDVIVNFDITAIDVHGYQSVYTQVRPGIWYWILTGADKLVPAVSPDHDVTIFCFDQAEWKTPPGGHFPLLPNTPTSSCVPSKGKPFINMGIYSPDMNGNEVTFCHELMHAYTELANSLGLNVPDQMDTYYLNSTPDAPGGNFAIQWGLLAKFINPTMKPSVQQSTLDFLTQPGIEGFKATPYQDQRGRWTIGIGFIQLNGVPVTASTPAMTLAQAQAILKTQVQPYADAISECVTYAINQDQFDALVSICYNEGISAITNSTLVRDLNAGLVNDAADQFLRWKYVGAVISQGLLNRREKERALFLTQV